MLILIFFPVAKHRYEPFQNITRSSLLSMKNGFSNVQKNVSRGLLILKISQNNPQNVLISQKHFHNITIFQGYPWNIFEIDIREKF